MIVFACLKIDVSPIEYKKYIKIYRTVIHRTVIHRTNEPKIKKKHKVEAQCFVSNLINNKFNENHEKKAQSIASIGQK